MSLSGKPAQDLQLSNLAVKNSLVTPKLTAANLSAANINGISTSVRRYNILSIFTGAKMGVVTVQNGYSLITFKGILNQSGSAIPPDTVIAYVENAVTDAPILLPSFIYCSLAPNIAGASFLGISTIHENGTITFSTALTANDVKTGCTSRARVMNNTR